MPAPTWYAQRPRTEVSRLKLSLVIPFYNESGGVDVTLTRVFDELARLDVEPEVVAVNDGSSDDTLAELRAAQRLHRGLVVVDLSRNFGKECALSAGLAQASGDAVVPMDADLQDPPELLGQLLMKWREGFEVVLARRTNRHSDSVLKRSGALGFYRLINRLSEVAIPENVGDFRLLDRVVVDALLTLPESRRFMKGLFAWIGFRTTVVDYVRPPRGSGTSKFNFLRLWNLAIEGITSFSIVPLRIWMYLGVAVAAASFGYALWLVTKTLLFGVDTPGYASLMTVMLFMSGVQLIGLGMIGEYLGRTYLESKRRPPYVIRRVYRAADADDQD